MSKIGKTPIPLPEGVKINLEGQLIKISGPKGELSRLLPRTIQVETNEHELKIVSKGKSKFDSAIYGTTRALIFNMVQGVSRGWKKELELVGSGYKAQVADRNLVLAVGFSHPVTIEAPEGIGFKVEKMLITVEGIDKELVGQIAAKIRSVKPPEPYKGKGIKYQNEVIRRKVGKAAKTAGPTA